MLRSSILSGNFIQVYGAVVVACSRDFFTIIAHGQPVERDSAGEWTVSFKYSELSTVFAAHAGIQKAIERWNGSKTEIYESFQFQ